MADEKAALVVDEELVEGSSDRAGDAEPFDGPLDDASERLRPMLAADCDAAALDLPCAPNIRVDDGLGPAPMGSTRCRLDQLLRLGSKQRQSDRANALDLYSRCKQLGAAHRIEIARPVDAGEDLGKLFSDAHGAPSFANHRGYKSSDGLSSLLHDTERRFRESDCVAAAVPGARKNGSSILVEDELRPRRRSMGAPLHPSATQGANKQLRLPPLH